MWRQWKTPRRRQAGLLEMGYVRGWQAILLAAGLRYHAKAQVLPVGLFARLFQIEGVPSLFEECYPIRLEPPCTYPYARW